MKTATANKQQSLLADAFEVLLRNLGPEKTAQLWQIMVAPQGEYRTARQKLFFGKNLSSLFREARKFNRKR